MPVHSVFISPRFDPHQFAGRRNRAVSAESQIAFSDYDRMRTVQRATFRNQRWIPAFVNNEQQLRHVLAQRTYDYYKSYAAGKRGGFEQVPESLVDDFQKLIDLATETLKKREANTNFLGDFITVSEQQLASHWAHIGAVKRATSYLAMITAVAYRSWKLGWPSTEVAESLSITPWNVREQRYRLCQAAKRLGYETFPPHPTCGRSKSRQYEPSEHGHAGVQPAPNA